MADDNSSSSLSINSYHCLCSTLVLTTAFDLQKLPHRAEPLQDGALILPPPTKVSQSEHTAVDQPSTSVLLNAMFDRKPLILRREDGFEKRRLLRCTRCKLVLGYGLDEAQDNAGPIYLLPGGMMSTTAMKGGVQPPTPSWARENA
ncbi:hypothetical protein RBB50_009485 [Rhinocladiella similis]